MPKSKRVMKIERVRRQAEKMLKISPSEIAPPTELGKSIDDMLYALIKEQDLRSQEERRGK